MGRGSLSVQLLLLTWQRSERQTLLQRWMQLGASAGRRGGQLLLQGGPGPQITAPEL